MKSSGPTEVSRGADATSQYVLLRTAQVEINTRIMARLARPSFVAAAQRLGIWHKARLTVSSTSVADVLSDVCLYDCFAGDKNPILRYQATATPAPGTPEALVIEAMARLPPVSLYRIQRRLPGSGCEMRDLLTGEDVFVMDRGLGQTAEGGWCLATRLIRIPSVGINMATGAAMAVETTLAEQMVGDIHAELGRGAKTLLAHMGAEERARYSIRMLREILAELSAGDRVSEVRTKHVE